MRLVHLARASGERGIGRAGIRGEKRLVPGASALQEIARAVYAMPMLPDFATTYQWLRELRRWHGERMIAVHFTVADDELVLVGRYGSPHARVAAREAVRRVREAPAGAEIVVTRSVPRRDVVAIREMPQLVGWVGTPEPSSWGCVCSACLPPGMPDRVRRLRAAYTFALADVRRAKSTRERLTAMARLDIPLEGARGRLDHEPLVRLARARDPEIRATAARLLSYFPFRTAGEPLAALLRDGEGSVRAAAAQAVVWSGGPARAAELATDEDAAVVVARQLAMRDGSPASASALEALAGRGSPILTKAVAKTAAILLSDDADDAKLNARLRALLSPSV